MPGYTPEDKLGRKSPKEIVDEQRRKQPEGPPSQNRKYNTKGSDYKPGKKDPLWKIDMRTRKEDA